MIGCFFVVVENRSEWILTGGGPAGGGACTLFGTLRLPSENFLILLSALVSYEGVCMGSPPLPVLVNFKCAGFGGGVGFLVFKVARGTW